METLTKKISETLNKKQNLCTLLEYVRNVNIQIDSNSIIFCEKNYVRNLIYTNDQFDIYCICWKRGQKSKIHSHPQNGCLMKILSGKLKECKFNNKLEKIVEKELSINDCEYMEGNKYLHDIEALMDTISLHIYSPPKFVAKCFDTKME